MSTDGSMVGVDARALLKAARSAQARGEIGEAIAGFRAALALAPDLGAAAIGLCRILRENGERDAARRELLDWIANFPSHANILAAAREWETLVEADFLRVALIGSGTLDSLGDHLRIASARGGVSATLHVCGFGQWAQELIDPQSPMAHFAPDVVFLAVDAEALFPMLARDPLSDRATVDAEIATGLGQFGAWIDTASARMPGTTFVVHTFPAPEHSVLGIADTAGTDGQRRRFARLDDAVHAWAAARSPQVVLLDQERVEASFGKSRVRDDRMWFLASLPFSDAFLPALASAQTRVLRAVKGRARKCVVVDLDNTLWGGVVGEDGVDGIHVGGTVAPGNAFAAFQTELDHLRRRGILLAVCSKNNPEDALPALEGREGMVLRKQHFSALRINWNDKATNIRDIAVELNIGLDSLVFLDDNPAERALVRERLPMVLVPELPTDPARYPRLVRELDVFDTVALTTEDLERSRQYREQQERKEFEQQASGDLHGYLHGLGITVKIVASSAANRARIAQLINKTNQFNTTTRRHSETMVESMAASDEWRVRAAQVGDRFGDSGLTAVAIARCAADVWELDSFLLSCRVMARGIEDALLLEIAEEARRAGASRLRAWFLPTAKNAPAADFFPRMGMCKIGDDGSGGVCWEWDLASEAANAPMPAWLAVDIAVDDHSMQNSKEAGKTDG